ncbi:LOW QUALITY PROTEIN: methyltransferase-like protein 27 [Erethizon dorsatum]
MAQEDGRLPEVLERVTASHCITDLAQKLQFYDRWAPDYDQDVAALRYRAPSLAVGCLTIPSTPTPPTGLILDVACGTGLVAAKVRRSGFLQLHGVGSSPGMLEQAWACGLYRQLSLCTLGQEPRPSPESMFNAVPMVGALSDGQVRRTAIPELLSPPPLHTIQVWMTTRTNSSNLPYKETLETALEGLEQDGMWECLVAQPADHGELATSTLAVPSTCAKDGFILGIIYLYWKRG